MSKIIIDEERCKGCALCGGVCPRKLISMSEKTNSMGYHPAIFSQSEECTGCTFCAQICAEVAIEVYR